MDEEKYIEVRIIDPIAKIPASDISRSTKASNDECLPSSAQRVDSFRNLNQSFDIDLLLRYYACNANMEKSINKVLTKAEEKCFSYSSDPPVDQGCKDRENQGRLIELRALYNIFDSLKRPSSEDTLLSTFRFHNAITKLQSLVARCTDEQLQQILSSDPALKMCKHCGVISCSNSPNVSIQPRKSPPNTSYFLNTQIFSSNDDNNNSKLCREMEKFGKKQATTRTGKRRDAQKNAKQFTYTRYADNKRDGSSRGVNLNFRPQAKMGTGIPRRVDTMVAERENDNPTHGMCTIQRPAEINFENNKNEICDNIKAVAMELQGKLSPVIEKTDKIINNSGTTRRMKSNSNLEVENEQEVLHKSEESVSKCNEKVVKNILYVKSISQSDEVEKQDCKRNQLLNYSTANNIDSIIDLMTYLAHSGLKSTDRKKKEFVSQFDERTCAPSRRSNNKSSFVLHASRDDHPQLDSAFEACNKVKYSNEATNNKCKDQKLHFRNYYNCSEHWEYIRSAKNNKGSNSVTCLMEDDSLENCTKASSYTTNCSSSSAEHMIREWVKPPQTDKESSAYDKTCEQPVNDTHPSSEITKNCPYCSQASVGKWHSELSKSQTENDFPGEQTVPYILRGDSKLRNSQEPTNRINSKKADHFGTGKLFRPLKSIKSIKSTKSSEGHKHSSNNLMKNITRRITYSESSFSDDGRCGEVANILLLYREILRHTEGMDWNSFEKFIENLHPSEKDLWRDVCKAVNNEAKRIADKGNVVTEVCIEISAGTCKGTKNEGRTCSNDEIVFEMDMALRDVERFLDWRLASTEKAQADTLQRDSQVIAVQNAGVSDNEVASNQAD